MQKKTGREKPLRRCTRCGDEKFFSEFRKRKQSSDGYHRWCKTCCIEYGRTHYEENKERYNELSKKYIEENAEEVAEYKRQWHSQVGRNRHLLKYYDITTQQYENLLEDQGGGCAICGKTPEEEGRFLAVDHSHKTGKIRGLLCIFCNKFVISRHEESSLLYKAAEYLENADTGFKVPDAFLKGRKTKRKRKSRKA